MQASNSLECITAKPVFNIFAKPSVTWSGEILTCIITAVYGGINVELTGFTSNIGEFNGPNRPQFSPYSIGLVLFNNRAL